MGRALKDKDFYFLWEPTNGRRPAASGWGQRPSGTPEPRNVRGGVVVGGANVTRAKGGAVSGSLRVGRGNRCRVFLKANPNFDEPCSAICQGMAYFLRKFYAQ